MKDYNIIFWHGLFIDDVVIEGKTIYQALKKFKLLHGSLDDIIEIKILDYIRG